MFATEKSLHTSEELQQNQCSGLGQLVFQNTLESDPNYHNFVGRVFKRKGSSHYGALELLFQSLNASTCLLPGFELGSGPKMSMASNPNEQGAVNRL